MPLPDYVQPSETIPNCVTVRRSPRSQALPGDALLCGSAAFCRACRGWGWRSHQARVFPGRAWEQGHNERESDYATIACSSLAAHRLLDQNANGRAVGPLVRLDTRTPSPTNLRSVPGQARQTPGPLAQSACCCCEITRVSCDLLGPCAGGRVLRALRLSSKSRFHSDRRSAL